MVVKLRRAAPEHGIWHDRTAWPCPLAHPAARGSRGLGRPEPAALAAARTARVVPLGDRQITKRSRALLQRAGSGPGRLTIPLPRCQAQAARTAG